MRKADFRRGKRLGKKDHIVRWPKPFIRWMDKASRKALPEFLEVRECCISIQQPGFRSKTIVVVTTLLDAVEFTKEDIAELYFRRWNVELDLRSLKTVMQMDMLRCKTTEACAKRNLDTHTCLQPDPHDHGSGCNQARRSSQIDQLQRHHSIVRGFPATHCILLRTR